MSSINQSFHRDALPDFRNLGVMLRIVFIVLLLSGLAALSRSPAWGSPFDAFIDVLVSVQPAMVLSLLLLWTLNGWLRKVDYRIGILVVLLIELAVAGTVYQVLRPFMPHDADPGLARCALVAMLVSTLILYYFHLRSRALSPALSEARLQALQARIRPHFLFNSLNAVLSLIRQEPKRAEAALEDMADLFRVVMADNSDLSTLEREVELARQYLGLEQLRLGERLHVEWHVDATLGDALIPPLVLQPLVENAVYHGVEPSSDRGVISIDAYKSGGEVHIALRNPYRPGASHHAGNKMALSNIRERLSLHFDAEARLRNSVTDEAYEVHIVLPYRTERR